MATYSQKKHILSLTTPLGEDALLLTAFSGQESLSRLFSFQLEMLSEKDSIGPADIVGKSVTWCVQNFHDEPRSSTASSAA
jgi:type VI secretion system secreted protein VgrG